MASPPMLAKGDVTNVGAIPMSASLVSVAPSYCQTCLVSPMYTKLPSEATEAGVVASGFRRDCAEQVPAAGQSVAPRMMLTPDVSTSYKSPL